ncbi:MraY family glycosyltransferase [Limnobacter alexandrii]|uniref:MraY family glycosyltransferase n=1 Tax=Limnobacter alexandrii TaxID=2570352 RepID=UPI0011094374|nr:glycosyltransferase [Limnobacter alexandrii]
MQTIEAIKVFWPAALTGIICSLLVSLVIVATKRWHGAFSMDGTNGVQKFHTMPTPRIGGIALAAGFLGTWFVLPHGFSQGTATLLGLVLIGGIPAFAAGLLEDFTKTVSVKARLLATAASGLLAALITGYWVNSVHVPGIDSLLAFAPIGILFTAFAIAGIANSVNIIDGFNGLASGVVILMLLTIGVIAFRVDDTAVLNMAILGAAVVAGFMLVNYPKGFIFLGDAGAYSLGYYVAVLAVALAMRNPADVSPWAMLLVCGYPFIETLFSIYRRASRKRKHNPGCPDASHLHSLIYRRVVSRKLLPYAPAWKRNAYTSPFLWVYSFIPMLGAIFWPESLGMVVAWLVISFVVYQRMYRRMLRLSIYFRNRKEMAS